MTAQEASCFSPSVIWCFGGFFSLLPGPFRSNDLKELEIVVLRHELAILRRRTPPSGVDVDRPALPRGGQPTPPARTAGGSFIVTPATLLRWHRRLVAKRWTYARRAGRPALRREIRALVIRFARGQPAVGVSTHRRRTKGLGMAVSATTCAHGFGQRVLDRPPRAAG